VARPWRGRRASSIRQTYTADIICTSGGPNVKRTLTLRLDEHLIERAKRHSNRTGKPVSQLVADYFAVIAVDEPIAGTELTPRVRSMIGALKGATTTEDEYRRYLETKHQ